MAVVVLWTCGLNSRCLLYPKACVFLRPGFVLWMRTQEDERDHEEGGLMENQYSLTKENRLLCFVFLLLLLVH